jgi:uncharacterized protein with PQ loop repeat
MGIVLNVAYLSIMIAFAQRRSESVGRLVATCALFAAYYAALTVAVPRSQWTDVLGLTGTLTAVAFAASPLADVARMLRVRDASSIPLPMVSMLALCATSWAVYGALLANVWMVVPNVLNAAIAGAQTALALALPGPGARKRARSRAGSSSASASASAREKERHGKDEPMSSSRGGGGGRRQHAGSGKAGGGSSSTPHGHRMSTRLSGPLSPTGQSTQQE